MTGELSGLRVCRLPRTQARQAKLVVSERFAYVRRGVSRGCGCRGPETANCRLPDMREPRSLPRLTAPRLGATNRIGSTASRVSLGGVHWAGSGEARLKATTKKPRAVGIEVFAGAGGLGLGAALAGVDVRYAVEKDPWAAETYARNHANTQVLGKDVREVSAGDFDSFRRRRVPLILFGGPPCRGFSYSNQRTRNRSNPDNWLFKEFLRLAAALQPEWIVFENVKGIRETAGGYFLRALVRATEKCGFKSSSCVLNAADFGVPQKRERFIMVGRRDGRDFELEKALSKFRVRAPSVKEAIGDLPRLRNGASQSWMPYSPKPVSEFADSLRLGRSESPNHLVTKSGAHVVERYRFVPQGGNWLDIPRRLLRGQGYVDCHTGLYHRLREDLPSVVLGNFRKNMLIHPWQERGLSVREAARLQSFPDSYEFVGSIGFQQQQAGNAVPPLLARAVFKCLLDQEL